MSKVKNPLQSFNAAGSLGDTLTFQKRGAGTMVRKKPRPTDTYTMAQAYWRWDYQDYAALWHTLSVVERQQWETDARRQKITGFNYWLRNRLNNLPDLVGRWRFDELSGLSTKDTSKNDNTGTIFGAQHVDGHIGAALYFDGIDDRVECGNDPSVYSLNALSYSLFIYGEAWQTNSCLISSGASSFLTISSDTGALLWIIYNDTVSQWMRLLDASEYLPTGKWNHIGATWDGLDMLLFVNGAQTGRPARQLAAPLKVTASQLTIGRRSDANHPAKASLDSPTIYNRALTPTEMKRHAERRYPA